MEGSRIQVLGPVVSSNNMGSVRRARELADIAPQYVAKSGLCNASELESSRGGSVRIQHVTSLANASEGKSRFPKLDECAHFHYEHVEIGPLQVSIVDDDDLKPLSNEPEEGKWWSLSVTSQNRTWLIRRSYDNFRMLDQQLHRCIYDRKFSELTELPVECIEEQENLHKLLSNYFTRFSSIAGSLINCGPVLNWLELDNRGHRLIVPDTDNCPINTPAVAAAYSVKRYTAQAPDEISFEIGDMISVIDMPPPEESIWWRGKRGFQVGFFPCECVAVIGDKVPRNLQITPQASQPMKPVLRKHGKLIAFFRSFILSRPSRRRLKQSGILKERVFGCDLGEHLLNSGHEIPMVLKCCVEFIETHGLVDGIYRLSGITSNIQKLRNAFDEDRVPALYEDEAILQDVHSVASLLKMYFRELPNPLCTYQLYHQFVGAMQATQGDDTKLLKMRDVVQKLPPPHYRTLEYLMRHLARVSDKGRETGMTSRNVAIVWAPNLLRCKELEVGGVAALQGVGIQAVVTEFLVCYADLIFCDKLPNFSLPPPQVSSKKNRPKSLAISTPTKLLSLEEARNRALLQAAGKMDQDYIEVGGGPATLPAKYHTVIELPGSSRKRAGSKRSPIGWKILFGKSGRSSQSRKDMETKSSVASDFGIPASKAVTELDLAQSKRRLRPAKSVESLNSSSNSTNLDLTDPQSGFGHLEDSLSPLLLRSVEGKSNGHNRSVSHESYFDQLPDQKEDPALDISEIQVNFDLEESEMRIFSEDETLMSGGSGSIASNNSPLLIPGQKSGKFLVSSVNKRLSLPKLVSTEDRFYVQSADPSPKKKKTNEGLPPISKLEEQLSNSAGDIQFIDSVSPDQVLVEAEVHPIQSPSSVSSISQMSSSLIAPSSPILPHIPHLQKPFSHTVLGCINNESKSSFQDKGSKSGVRLLSMASSEISPRSLLTSPSLVEATVSDNESFSLQSSELTTPETPIYRTYTPLVDLEDSSVSNLTTPDFESMYRKSSSETENLDRAMVKTNSEFDECQNIGKEVAKFEEKFKLGDIKPEYENTTPTLMKNNLIKEVVPPKPEERKPRPVHPYENIPLNKGVETEKRKLLETSFDVEDVQDNLSNRNSMVSVKYEAFSRESSCDSLVNVNREEECLLMTERKPYNVVESNPIISNDKESEINLLKECSDWLQSKQSFDPISGNECLKNTKNTDLKTNLEAEEWLKTKQLGSSVLPLSENVIVVIKENCESDDLLVGNENGNETVSSCISVENHSDKKVKADMGRDTFALIDFKRLSQVEDQEKSFFVSQNPVKKKILETNLDDVENLKTSKIPVPKKRTSPQKSSPSGNVQVLLSKFEISSATKQNLVGLRLELNELKTNKNDLHLKKNLEERPKTLERLSTRRKTEDLKEFPETQLEKSKSGSEINEKYEKVDILLNSNFDLSDPQRRERIEKYKEKRRNYLREKYRSDSFKNDRDDFVLKIKQRHFPKVEGDTPKESKWSPLSSPEKKFLDKPQRRGSLPKLQESPVKNFPTISSSADLSERLRHEIPIISNSIQDHSTKKSNFLRLSSERKTAADFRSLKSSPEKKSWEFSFGAGANEWGFPELHGFLSTRRRMTDPSRPGKSGEELNVRRRYSNSVNKSYSLLSGSSSTPSFCIKDLAALFEKKDESKIHKQYLSSV